MDHKKIRVKPGKTSSVIGFVVGIGFVLTGLTMVIPTFGLFGVFWTIIALVMTVQNYLNAFTDKGVPTHEITVEDAEGNRTGDADNYNIEYKLKQLNALLEQNLITRDEFEEKRKELLKRF